MRLLTMLATAVLLAACVHDTDDFTLFVVESGASLTYKKDCPVPGDRFWRTVQGESWGPVSDNLVADMTGTWARDHFFTGASLLVELGGGKKDWDDPWNRISELFAGKAHDDPWDTIGESFPIESIHTGERKGRSFRGKPVVEMLFVSIGGEKGGEEDPWNRIGDLFPAERSGELLLRLVEVRGQVGRFLLVFPSDGESLDGQSVFAVGMPVDWEPGLVLRGEAYLLDAQKTLSLIPRPDFASSGSPEVLGAVVWEVDRNLSLPKHY